MSYKTEHTVLIGDVNPRNGETGSWLRHNFKYLIGGTVIILLAFLGVSAMNMDSRVHRVSKLKESLGGADENCEENGEAVDDGLCVLASQECVSSQKGTCKTGLRCCLQLGPSLPPK